ncbi:MAG: hypothetical protein O3A00_27695 [Planctomycetota bacterium]|nr:hypothetical protein [Planctomycetota bacterium]
MLIFQIGAALERTRLFLTLAQAGQRSHRFTQMDTDQTRPDPCPSASICGGSLPDNGEKPWIEQAREKPYEPHVPGWDDWEPPAYTGVFQAGDIGGYHCRNDEIDRLHAEIDALDREQ